MNDHANSNTGQEWTFAMDSQDNFIFSRIGTGGSEFKVYKTGRVVMGPGGAEAFDLQPNGDLEISGNLTANGVVYASDRNKKTAILPMDSASVLDAVVRLPVSTWRFNTEDERIRHAGPMAQDFYAAFGLGSDETTISASDISGVALAAIQGLYRENAETRAALAERDVAIAQLREEKGRQQAQIDELMKAVASLRALQAPRKGVSVETETGE